MNFQSGPPTSVEGCVCEWGGCLCVLVRGMFGCSGGVEKFRIIAHFNLEDAHYVVVW